jgi:hypothetical protein
VAELRPGLDDLEVREAGHNFGGCAGEGVAETAYGPQGVLIHGFDAGASVHGEFEDIFRHRVFASIPVWPSDFSDIDRLMRHIWSGLDRAARVGALCPCCGVFCNTK